MSDIEQLRKISLLNKTKINQAKNWTGEKLEKWYKEEFLPQCQEMAKFGLSRIDVTSVLWNHAYYEITQITTFLEVVKGFKIEHYGGIYAIWDD